MTAYFTGAEEKLMARPQVHRDELGEEKLADSPCVLLTSQLRALEQSASKVQEYARLLRASMKERGHG